MADVQEVERLARLEEKVEGINKRLDRVEQRLDRLEQETKSLREELHRLDKKFTILILIVIFLIVFLNQSALEFFFRVIGLLK